MPSSQMVRRGPLEINVVPDDWLHRVLHWPFYFEFQNPRFRFLFRNIGEGTSTVLQIPLQVTYANQTIGFKQQLEVPALEPGAVYQLISEEIMTAYPGQVILDIPIPGSNGMFDSLYAYRVRSEEQLWIWCAGALLVVGS